MELHEYNAGEQEFISGTVSAHRLVSSYACLHFSPKGKVKIFFGNPHFRGYFFAFFIRFKRQRPCL